MTKTDDEVALMHALLLAKDEDGKPAVSYERIREIMAEAGYATPSTQTISAAAKAVGSQRQVGRTAVGTGKGKKYSERREVVHRLCALGHDQAKIRTWTGYTRQEVSRYYLEYHRAQRRDDTIIKE